MLHHSQPMNIVALQLVRAGEKLARFRGTANQYNTCTHSRYSLVLIQSVGFLHLAIATVMTEHAR